MDQNRYNDKAKAIAMEQRRQMAVSLLSAINGKNKLNKPFCGNIRAIRRGKVDCVDFWKTSKQKYFQYLSTESNNGVVSHSLQQSLFHCSKTP